MRVPTHYRTAALVGAGEHIAWLTCAVDSMASPLRFIAV
ncbi:hypothetical protein J2785_007228 [Burkholderia ambifaria]|nr:hypothetical protein [Burkholderia ambifaria]